MATGGGHTAAMGSVLTKLPYDLGIGLFLLLLQTLMTFLVVGRVVERQDERKRRAVSGLAEARVLEGAEGLLADGVPLRCREPSERVVTVGRSEVRLHVEAIEWGALDEQQDDARELMFNGLVVACGRYGAALAQPLFVSIIEPKVAPDLVHLVNELDLAREALAEWRQARSI